MSLQKLEQQMNALREKMETSDYIGRVLWEISVEAKRLSESAAFIVVETMIDRPSLDRLMGLANESIGHGGQMKKLVYALTNYVIQEHRANTVANEGLETRQASSKKT